MTVMFIMFIRVIITVMRANITVITVIITVITVSGSGDDSDDSSSGPMHCAVSQGGPGEYTCVLCTIPARKTNPNRHLVIEGLYPSLPPAAAMRDRSGTPCRDVFSEC